MLTSAARGETLIPNPNECNSTLTSVTGGFLCPYIIIGGIPPLRKNPLDIGLTSFAVLDSVACVQQFSHVFLSTAITVACHVSVFKYCSIFHKYEVTRAQL